MSNVMTDEMLAVTGRGLKSFGLGDEFFSWDNQNLDAPAYSPSGAAWSATEGASVIVARYEMF